MRRYGGPPTLIGRGYRVVEQDAAKTVYAAPEVEVWEIVDRWWTEQPERSWWRARKLATGGEVVMRADNREGPYRIYEIAGLLQPPR